MCAARVHGKFFERRDHPLILHRVLRAAADLGESKLGEQAGDRPLAVDHLEALLDHSLQVDPPRSDDAIDGRIGTALDDLGQLRHLRLARQMEGPVHGMRSCAHCSISHGGSSNVVSL